tara:strand:- start:6233 stop:7129 length:897 start_codon:yes stop_codon:yes gene_type:complete
MLAVGVVTSHNAPCVLRSASGADAPVATWRCVVGNESALGGQAEVLRTPCADAPAMPKQVSCACKFYHFTKFAFHHSTAEYILKVEADTIVNYRTLLAELARLRHVPLLWMGLFQWASHSDDGRGRYCGGGDGLHTKPPLRCVVKGARGGTTAPFASGGFDLKRRDLVRKLLHCTAYGNTTVGACDGGQGHRVARCISTEDQINMVDLTWLRFNHHPSNHTIVLHNQKHRRSVHWNSTLTPRPLPRLIGHVTSSTAAPEWSVLDWRLAPPGEDPPPSNWTLNLTRGVGRKRAGGGRPA